MEHEPNTFRRDSWLCEFARKDRQNDEIVYFNFHAFDNR